MSALCRNKLLSFSFTIKSVSRFYCIYCTCVCNSMRKVSSKYRSIVNCNSNIHPLFHREGFISALFITKRWKSKDCDDSLFIPVPVKLSSNPDDINVGEELTSKLNKADILQLLNQLHKQPIIKKLAEENGLNTRLFHQAFISFRRFCMESETLPVDIHIVFSDILQGGGHVDDLFPYFLQHARQTFPHLECMEDLKKISDLRIPANWYPEARALNRKIIFHAGPTNSGKTYHALERFNSAKSGIYCGPLKLLAAEVFHKTNEKGTPCDLVTGEERQYANPDGTSASHVSCTVEMASVTQQYEVAVIDEIQMIRDIGRGWAWTRTLLGITAEEIHLCGEEAALDLVHELTSSVGEEIEVRRYKRLTKLTIEDQALDKLDNIRPGDCIVCFSKNDIYSVSLQIEKLGHECAVIYGSLPPGTKLAQAQQFNDKDHPCKILVATDAIGMGLNLSIRRIIFYSLMKPTLNEKGEKEMDTLSTSQALQIAGRAGRYNTHFPEGFVTTFRKEDLPLLKDIMARPVQSIETAGLHPTADQIELFAYNLPHATLSNLIDIFVSLSQLDTSCYFMCNNEDFKFLADMIQHVPLPLRARYVFCCAPINRKNTFVCSMFLKFARQYSRNEPLTFDWVCRNIGWPLATPKTILDLVHLEGVFDILDLYLWLSYRFQDLFPHSHLVRDIQKELDVIIQQGVFNITHLLRAGVENTESAAQAVDNNSVKSFQKQRLKDMPHQSDVTKDDNVPFINEKSVNVGKGRLTDHLLTQGLLTPKILKELQKEWKKENNCKLNETVSTKGKKKILKRDSKRSKKK